MVSSGQTEVLEQLKGGCHIEGGGVDVGPRIEPCCHPHPQLCRWISAASTASSSLRWQWGSGRTARSTAHPMGTALGTSAGPHCGCWRSWTGRGEWGEHRDGPMWGSAEQGCAPPQVFPAGGDREGGEGEGVVLRTAAEPVQTPGGAAPRGDGERGPMEGPGGVPPPPHLTWPCTHPPPPPCSSPCRWTSFGSSCSSRRSTSER